MNTELLEEDETKPGYLGPTPHVDWNSHAILLRQRLIEAREKNASLQKTYDVYSEGCAARIDELEAELAEVRKAGERLIEALKDISKIYPSTVAHCISASDSVGSVGRVISVIHQIAFAAIDAAMTEKK